MVEIARRLLNTRARESYAIRFVWVRRGGKIAEGVFLPPRSDEHQCAVCCNTVYTGKSVSLEDSMYSSLTTDLSRWDLRGWLCVYCRQSVMYARR